MDCPELPNKCPSLQHIPCPSASVDLKYPTKQIPCFRWRTWSHHYATWEGPRLAGQRWVTKWSSLVQPASGSNWSPSREHKVSSMVEMCCLAIFKADEWTNQLICGVQLSKVWARPGTCQTLCRMLDRPALAEATPLSKESNIQKVSSNNSCKFLTAGF